MLESAEYQKAKELFEKAGIDVSKLNAILKQHEAKEKAKTSTLKPATTTLKPHYHTATTRCTLCNAISTRYFKMTPQSVGLSSEEVTELPTEEKPTNSDILVPTCKFCKTNLSELPKVQLVEMLIEARKILK